MFPMVTAGTSPFLDGGNPMRFDMRNHTHLNLPKDSFVWSSEHLSFSIYKFCRLWFVGVKSFVVRSSNL